MTHRKKELLTAGFKPGFSRPWIDHAFHWTKGNSKFFNYSLNIGQRHFALNALLPKMTQMCLQSEHFGHSDTQLLLWPKTCDYFERIQILNHLTSWSNRIKLVNQGSPTVRQSISLLNVQAHQTWPMFTFMLRQNHWPFRLNPNWNNSDLIYDKDKQR